MSAEQHLILVVDDNPATLYSTSRVLRSAGFEVITATNGTDGVQAACDNEPDLIVLDVNLPDIDGFEVVRRVRAVPRIAHVPILHLSATFVQDAYKVQGLDAGANGYLTHPVEPPVLVASIRAFLRTRRAEEALRQSEDRFKAVFERALDGIALLSSDLIFMDANPALCRILGRARDEVVGKQAAALAPRGSEEDLGRVGAVVAREGAWRGQLPMLRADGTRVELEWSVSRHSDPDVRLAIVTDVTQRRAIEVEREQLLQREQLARGDAEKANRLKDDFLATLSHELRSPLNSIVGWTTLLQRRVTSGNVPSGELTDALAVIDRNARLQTQLIADLLDVSRITSGQMRLEIAPIDPDGPLHGAIEGVRPAAAARQVRIEIDIDAAAGPILGDASRLQQVFWNLLTNAVKFTPRDGTVWVSLAREGQNVVVSVRDTGCGMDPKFVPFVFDRFRQESTTAERTYGGLGIGLAIVRHLVEMHGGCVSAASEGKDRGSTFTVRLPVVERSASKGSRFAGVLSRDSGGHRPSVNLEGLKVLVVDEDVDSRDLLSRALSDRGASVQSASSTREALELAESTPPRVLVSDIGIPGEDGCKLIAQLRERGRTAKDLHAIAVTAMARAEDRRRGLEAGYDDYLVKPVDLDALVDRLASIPQPIRES